LQYYAKFTNALALKQKITSNKAKGKLPHLEVYEKRAKHVAFAGVGRNKVGNSFFICGAFL